MLGKWRRGRFGRTRSTYDYLESALFRLSEQGDLIDSMRDQMTKLIEENARLYEENKKLKGE